MNRGFAGDEDDLRVAMSTDEGSNYRHALDSNPSILIIGGVAGFIVLIIAVTVGLIWFWYKKQKLTRIQYQLYPTKVGLRTCCF